MKLTTVLSAVNANPEYYLFIPKQILFWSQFQIRFVAVFVGEAIPTELLPWKQHILLWNRNLDMNTAFVAQTIRLYYPGLLRLPENELVMITDMDMLPMTGAYYTDGLESYTKDDFLYYRHIDGNQIYVTYNAAHPNVWATVFDARTEADVEARIREAYNAAYTGVPGSVGWYTDQELLYTRLIGYPHLKVLNRRIKRLEICEYKRRLTRGHTNFLHEYDDCHFHRSFSKNRLHILDAQRQITRDGNRPLWMRVRHT